jgi:hypothetical protein
VASPTLTRRTVLNTAALATTALAMPFVHGSYAAGRLSCGFGTIGFPAPTSHSLDYAASGPTRKK